MHFQTFQLKGIRIKFLAILMPIRMDFRMDQLQGDQIGQIFWQF